ncbi:hypothetical protein [Paenibacillus terrae]|uniref:Uncharacterized protein n=1 Tax=Paenibacillus terrae TaxID=159743 RepID=A0A0D7WVE8_9BACL|nr:hypothetical protein [Paenibacillus terrae]KJD42954.1 hypothetical protein QD47_25385 [Paenibacillus terrae]
MRKSIKTIKHMVDQTKVYAKLPTELLPFYVYVNDNGHSLMGIANSVMSAELSKNSEPWELESAIPVKYVLEHEYQIRDGYLFIDVPYNLTFGIDVDDKYLEF